MTATMTLPFYESKPQSSGTRRIYISRGTAKRIARDARARDMECVVSYLLHSSDEGDAWRLGRVVTTRDATLSVAPTNQRMFDAG